MKPVEQAISDSSFTGHYLKLLLVRLKKFKNAKHVVLGGIVLVCILARYLVLMNDKLPDQGRPESVTDKYQKPALQFPKLQISPNSPIHRINLSRFRQTDFYPEPAKPVYFIANEVQ